MGFKRTQQRRTCCTSDFLPSNNNYSCKAALIRASRRTSNAAPIASCWHFEARFHRQTLDSHRVYVQIPFNVLPIAIVYLHTDIWRWFSDKAPKTPAPSNRLEQLFCYYTAQSYWMGKTISISKLPTMWVLWNGEKWISLCEAHRRLYGCWFRLRIQSNWHAQPAK